MAEALTNAFPDYSMIEGDVDELAVLCFDGSEPIKKDDQAIDSLNQAGPIIDTPNQELNQFLPLEYQQ
tara:strand:- start:284 stop:487 length:204 start_codon:yes stop_codon:yes gene_type:complete